MFVRLLFLGISWSIEVVASAKSLPNTEHGVPGQKELHIGN